MNRRGQSLVAVLIMTAMICIATWQLMAFAYSAFNIQARLRRTNAWLALQGNVLQLLRNQQSCAATVGTIQPDGTVWVMISPQTVYTALGQHLAPDTIIDTLRVDSGGIGTPVIAHFDNGVGNCGISGNGNGHQQGCDATASQVFILTVREKYGKLSEYHTAQYAITVLYNNTQILGCAL